ncbi:MAG: phenylalanine--tRNA ligase subunit beta [Candidatus Magasanikbacteria bacterium CG11_big_fil_rev_8_21_14_0_20_43_7]|uniref:Phenylalanine--tRNA ligase beta subunit n=1 Tax=Candidatus Magasanikbacteria bacterium CG11_big_fil_rev_8_21_14_0_20_43_7 TaxID=1974654 RepID=A0A2H0N292_9BACT|nr:MAG: phenylalanine--tRNA ligase subunit beta [Candidatus Magasanikbacteria bacterium CG11_big_fil_rev_8_21_14_0_20_43_7]
MLVSKQWIEQFTDIPKHITPEQLGEDLTLHVVEVEGVIDEAMFLENIVVGRVASVQDHPNADTLKICTVEFGQDHPAQVVCGGNNVTEGMLCVFGALGAKVRWHGEGDLIELKKATIRGVESYGMICASDEIGLGEMFPAGDEKEILNLSDVFGSSDTCLVGRQDSDDSNVVGKPLAEALGLEDIVFDIDNKSMTHRPDLWGQYGMAREVAALYGQALREYMPAKIGKPEGTACELSVHVQASDACPRYMALVLDGIEVDESPEWLKKRLMVVGVNSINNIVDITNYVMLELGQPMHAFDADQLTTNNEQLTINIRKAKSGEQFISLDEKEYSLTTEDLVIATDDRVIALAGVKGSGNSGVTDDTKRIVFESANFDAVTVRRTASRHGLRTDASARFEKALDPTMCELALRRAVELLKEVCPTATVSSTIVDQANFSLDQGPIALDTDFVQRKMGVHLETKEMVRILESLGFVVKQKKETLHVTVPTWRATKDISIPEDLVEEIARVYGYDNIEPTLPTFPIEPPVRNELRELETKLRELLAYEAGYTEVSNYSFVGGETIENAGDRVEDYILLDNPIAKDRPYLRRYLVTNLLTNVEQNLHRFDTVKLFEIGKVFRADRDGEEDGIGGVLPRQRTLLSMAYAAKGQEVPFFELSTRFSETMSRFGVSVAYTASDDLFDLVHPGRYAVVTIDDTPVGYIGEVHPAVQEKIGIDARTAILEVTLNTLVEHTNVAGSYTRLPHYPEVERDIAFLVDTSAVHEDIATFLIEADALTVDVELFDVYMGTGVPEGKKSMAYRITYRSDEKTLEGAEVDVVHGKIITELEKKFGAEIR